MEVFPREDADAEIAAQEINLTGISQHNSQSLFPSGWEFCEELFNLNQVQTAQAREKRESH